MNESQVEIGRWCSRLVTPSNVHHVPLGTNSDITPAALIEGLLETWKNPTHRKPGYSDMCLPLRSFVTIEIAANGHRVLHANGRRVLQAVCAGRAQ